MARPCLQRQESSAADEPATIDALIDDAIQDILDADAWEQSQEEIDQGRSELNSVAGAWEKAVKAVNKKK
jgi:hypothetical protein